VSQYLIREVIYNRALDAHQRAGSRLGQANASALNELRAAQEATGDYQAATVSHRQALASSFTNASRIPGTRSCHVGLVIG
jgi:hypothetical protein